MVSQDTYRDLVDTPNETLSVEYKSWIDLAGSAEGKADLARHICAIANHGGGMIVFGFEDDLRASRPNPYGANAITRDTISAIVKKYLEPTFQCDVVTAVSTAGNSHPIVLVPPHGGLRSAQRLEALRSVENREVSHKACIILGSRGQKANAS